MGVKDSLPLDVMVVVPVEVVLEVVVVVVGLGVLAGVGGTTVEVLGSIVDMTTLPCVNYISRKFTDL